MIYISVLAPLVEHHNINSYPYSLFGSPSAATKVAATLPEVLPLLSASIKWLAQSCCKSSYETHIIQLTCYRWNPS